MPMNVSTIPCNIQSRILVYGSNPFTTCRPLSVAEEKRIDHIFRLADLVGPSDRFDEFALLAAKLSGGWLSSTHVRFQNVYEPSNDPQRMTTASQLCGESDPALPRCRAMVRELSAGDHALYDRAVARFEKSLAAARNDVTDEALAALRATSEARTRLNTFVRKCWVDRECMANETAKAQYASPKCKDGRIDLTPARRPRAKVYNHLYTVRECRQVRNRLLAKLKRHERLKEKGHNRD